MAAHKQGLFHVHQTGQLMLTDRYHFEHSSNSAKAVTAFETVVAAVAAHRPAAPALAETLVHDPDLVGALALKGLAAVIMASDGAMQMARELIPATDAALRKVPKGGTASERALADAHRLAAHGRLVTAAIRLEQHLESAPTDFLVVKLAHALRFMSGQTAAMLATTAAVLPAWKSNADGYGFVLGCHAFSLEENGSFTEAEAVGRQAVEHTAHDVWGLHAVAHVLEMHGRSREGIAWLRPTIGLWRECGNFGGHLAWHLALFQVSSGEHGAALAIFDQHLQTAPTCDFRDVANATSLLWRLEQEGIDVGERWRSVGEIAHARRRDTAYVFGSLHSLLALIGSNRIAAAQELITALRQSAARGAGDQAEVASAVGVELAETILAMALSSRDARRQAARPLAALGQRLPRLGGSIAQRDVFLRTLLLIALDAGDDVAAAKLKGLRLRQRKEDRFLALVDRRPSNAKGAPQLQLATA